MPNNTTGAPDGEHAPTPERASSNRVLLGIAALVLGVAVTIFGVTYPFEVDNVSKGFIVAGMVIKLGGLAAIMWPLSLPDFGARARKEDEEQSEQPNIAKRLPRPSETGDATIRWTKPMEGDEDWEGDRGRHSQRQMRESAAKAKREQKW